MKKTVVIFLQLFFFIQIAICQNKIIYDSNNTVLCIDSRTKQYRIFEDSDSGSSSDWVLAATNISEGKITVEGNFITCVDSISGMKISLKKIDEYRLVVINKNNCFNLIDTLYASVISDQNGKPYQWLKWKEGKRHGEWSIDGEKGVNYTLYKEGRIIKEYFRTYKEIMQEMLNAPYDPSDKP